MHVLLIMNYIELTGTDLLNLSTENISSKLDVTDEAIKQNILQLIDMIKNNGSVGKNTYTYSKSDRITLIIY